jgi:hypothetical protein
MVFLTVGNGTTSGGWEAIASRSVCSSTWGDRTLHNPKMITFTKFEKAWLIFTHKTDVPYSLSKKTLTRQLVRGNYQ